MDSPDIFWLSICKVHAKTFLINFILPNKRIENAWALFIYFIYMLTILLSKETLGVLNMFNSSVKCPQKKEYQLEMVLEEVTSVLVYVKSLEEYLVYLSVWQLHK